MEPAARPSLESFAAQALDWPAVRAVLRPLAASALGERALDRLVPRDAEDAARALQRARELLELHLAEGLEPPLGGCGDPRDELEQAVEFRSTLGGDGLAKLARFLRMLEDLGLWIAARRARVETCAALFAKLPDQRPLLEALDAALDSKGEVRDEASPVLARLRSAMAALEQTIEHEMKALARDPNLRAALAEGHAGRVHRRGGRPVLALRAQHAGRVRGIVHDRSQTGDTLFVEPESVVRHANALAELEADAAREIQRVLAELTRTVLQRRAALEQWAERTGELDLALIAARHARAVEGCIPRLASAERPGIVLRSFRHPLLLEQVRLGRIEAVVPLDLRLGTEFDLLVITGPNTGGKTLALKSAGLAGLLAALGLSLPAAEGTVVPVYDGIAADIGDEQEIQQNLSTFSSHLVRIRAGLERAGPRTLVLLDELGGGTDPTEGAALGEALLETLLARGVPTIASTHLGALKQFAYRHRRAENAHVEFDVESLRPLYRLVIGAPGESRALAIARRLGLPGAIVDRAREHLGGGGEDAGLLDEVRRLRMDAERLRGEAEQRVLDLERERTLQGAERELLDARAAQMEAEAQRGIEERVARARALLERGALLLPQLAPAQRAALTELFAGLSAALGDAALSDRRSSFLAGLKKGEQVWVPRFKKRCPIVRIHKEKRELDVKLGRRDLRLSFDDVTFYESL